jgi:hypothetical protein
VDEAIAACPSCATPLPWHFGVTRLDDGADVMRRALDRPRKGGSHERTGRGLIGIVWIGAIVGIGLFGGYVACGLVQRATSRVT